MKQKEHFEDENVQLSTCFMNSAVGEKKKPKAKRKSCLTQLELGTYEVGIVHGPSNLLKHGHEESRIHFPLSCKVSKANMGRYYPATF